MLMSDAPMTWKKAAVIAVPSGVGPTGNGVRSVEDAQSSHWFSARVCKVVNGMELSCLVKLDLKRFVKE